MTPTGVLESSAGFLLVFFVPGYTTTRAIFPEWRLRGADAWRRGVEVVTLSFVLSVAWTILVGYLLLAGLPGGFQAAWANPELEVTLLAVTLITFVAGWTAGAYSTVPPSGREPPTDPGEDGAWELTRALDRNAREARRVTHRLRQAAAHSSEAAELEARLASLDEESMRLRREREEQYGT